MKSTLTFPRLTLNADGGQLSDDDLQPLISLRVQQSLSLPAQCVLIFSSAAGKLDTAKKLLPGVKINLSVEGQDTPLFQGQITANELVYTSDGMSELQVRGYDILHQLRKRQQVKVFIQSTVSELIAELVSDLSITIDTLESTPLWQYIIQHDQSDFNLMVELLERCGLFFTLRDNTLFIFSLEGLPDEIDLDAGNELNEVSIEVNGEYAFSNINAQGWNPQRVESFDSRITSPRTGRTVSLEFGAFDLSGSDERWFTGEFAQDFDHIDGLAQSELDLATAHQIHIRGVSLGNPNLQPGSKINLTGIDEAFTGKYVLTGVTHTVDHRRGFLSEFTTEPPAIPRRPRSTVATLGEVTDVNDPETFGRVRVSLPAYNQVQTDWMQVISPGAGVNKGLIALPGVGDTVLVLFTHLNPAEGVVLGGFYGPYAPYDPGVDGNAVRRYSLRTPEGHLIRLDDVSKTIRLENSEGSFVEMAPGKVTIHAATDLEISAPGKSIVIQGSQIDFREA